ncbi:MAG: hypothetical protein ACFFCW_19835 [Candidatus Hodarchaeota archaeon]
MFALIKYFRVISLFRDAVTAYKEVEGTSKVPAVLHRRVFGVIILALGTLMGIYFGLDETLLGGQLTTITDNVGQIIAAAINLYGAVMIVVGMIKMKRKPK